MREGADAVPATVRVRGYVHAVQAAHLEVVGDEARRERVVASIAPELLGERVVALDLREARVSPHAAPLSK